MYVLLDMNHNLLCPDAIFGLRELLDEHPHLIRDNLTSLVNGCVRIIGDEVCRTVHG